MLRQCGIKGRSSLTNLLSPLRWQLVDFSFPDDEISNAQLAICHYLPHQRHPKITRLTCHRLKLTAERTMVGITALQSISVIGVVPAN